jgi:uncharacterized protein involved in outer membrane biogenesis
LTPSPSTIRHVSPCVRWGAAIGATLLLAVIVFILLFQWNWLRGPLAREISGRIHRPVSITGNLEVHPWSWSPSATVNGLVIGNAPWAGPAPLASFPRLTVQVKLLPLLRGKVIAADHPDVNLLRDAQDRANWVFNPSQPPKPLRLPAINHLIITGGALHYRDVRHHLTFAGTISSNEQVTSAGQGVFNLDGAGLLNSERFIAHVTGGALINVDPARPYRFDARVESGATRVRVDGQVTHPFDFGALSGNFAVSGPDFAELYHLTGLALPNTPPYALSAGFGRVQNVYAFRGIHGQGAAHSLRLISRLVACCWPTWLRWLGEFPGTPHALFSLRPRKSRRLD